jgi:hypothetical protein
MSRTYHHSKWGRRHYSKLSGWLSNNPSWWVRMFMTVPRRRKDAELLRRVIAGRVDPDGAAFEPPARGRRPPGRFASTHKGE